MFQTTNQFVYVYVSIHMCVYIYTHAYTFITNNIMEFRNSLLDIALRHSVFDMVYIHYITYHTITACAFDQLQGPRKSAPTLQRIQQEEVMVF